MSGATVEFLFDSADAEHRFLRTYLPDAWDRFREGEGWETGWFWAYRQIGRYEAGPDGGLVRLVFEGDPDALVTAESDHWDAFDGLSSWTLRRYEEEGYDSLLAQQRDAKGELAGEWDYRVKPLLSEFSLAYYREFEEPLPAVGEERDGDPVGYGVWAVLHELLAQWGYDWYEETDACQRAMKNRLKSIASYRGEEAAREEYERLLAEWQAHGEELDRWLDDHPTGTATEP